MSPHSEPSEKEWQHWQNFLIAWNSYIRAMTALKANAPNLVELVRKASVDPNQRSAAMDLARYLKDEQLQQLLGNLLAIACYRNGNSENARQLILRLPREWLIANIEAAAEKMLSNNDSDDYVGLFHLYRQLDPNLARRLAERAVVNVDPDVKAAGEYFMEMVDEDSK